MLTIHCYVCGADEKLSGTLKDEDSPLEKFMRLHAHAKGCGRNRFTCPCGSVNETNPTDETLISTAVDATTWWLAHEPHMMAADVGGEVDQWANWL